MKETRATFMARLAERAAPQTDIDDIMFAYDFAKEAHRTQWRDSGERYFEHVRAVALILLDELNWFDKELLIALLLHDTGEDSPILGNRLEDYAEFIRTARIRIQKMFGSAVADLVIKLTKPEVDGKQFRTKEEAHAYYLAELAKDPLALVGKALDRLHNVRCLAGTREEKRIRILAETTDIYLPLFQGALQHPETLCHMTLLISKLEEAMGVYETV